MPQKLEAASTKPTTRQRRLASRHGSWRPQTDPRIGPASESLGRPAHSALNDTCAHVRYQPDPLPRRQGRDRAREGSRAQDGGLPERCGRPRLRFRSIPQRARPGLLQVPKARSPRRRHRPSSAAITRETWSPCYSNWRRTTKVGTSLTTTHSELALERAYPRPRNQRLSRKSSAAVGKPPGSKNACAAVSSADSAGSIAMLVWPMQRPRCQLLLQTTKSWRSIGPVQFPIG